ncbi:MAG: methylthioribulose 1-phosphate dehydratase [Alphaproteobacteria bacterium]|nr:methylthioribulose 1-phosphate dehydratase [Alphaproteobacteria bacterium]MCD8526118.1 methylthioribulose 1-phosphate dehydratase [Alphaproteobacteria bacterium]
MGAATSGNFSARLADGSIAITVSGAHKGKLEADDIMRLDPNGSPLEDKKPSAEAALHVQIYKAHPKARAILHVHSVPGVALSRVIKGDELVLEGYEMLKVFPGITTHETRLSLPLVDNSQDMDDITSALSSRLKDVPAYIIRNHGFYVWAESMSQAENLVEGLDHLLQCEIETRRISQ